MVVFPQHDARVADTSVDWIEVRCAACGRLLHKMEPQALRAGKHIVTKCARCNAVNDLVGTDSAI